MTMRVGIAGTGTMGEVHAKAWRNVGVELAGFTSLHQAQTQDLDAGAHILERLLLKLPYALRPDLLPLDNLPNVNSIAC